MNIKNSDIDYMEKKLIFLIGIILFVFILGVTQAVYVWEVDHCSNGICIVD